METRLDTSASRPWCIVLGIGSQPVGTTAGASKPTPNKLDSRVNSQTTASLIDAHFCRDQRVSHASIGGQQKLSTLTKPLSFLARVNSTDSVPRAIQGLARYMRIRKNFSPSRSRLRLHLGCKMLIVVLCVPFYDWLGIPSSKSSPSNYSTEL